MRIKSPLPPKCHLLLLPEQRTQKHELGSNSQSATLVSFVFCLDYYIYYLPFVPFKKTPTEERSLSNVPKHQDKNKCVTKTNSRSATGTIFLEQLTTNTPEINSK